MPIKKGQTIEIDAVLQAALMRSVFLSLIADGHINPQGKSDAELKKEFMLGVKEFIKQKKIYWIIDHHESLLTEARNYTKRKKHEKACLFYATWFEHWINNLVSTRGQIYLSREEVKILIRDCSLKAKYSCFPTLLSLPRLSNDHIKTVLRITELRNSFVHYKFTPVDLDVPEEDDEAWKRDFKRTEQAVKYLQAYERKHIYKGKKDKAKQLSKT